MVCNVVLSILREDKNPRCGKPRSFVDLHGRGDDIFFNYYGPSIEISCICISALRVKTSLIVPNIRIRFQIGPCGKLLNRPKEMNAVSTKVLLQFFPPVCPFALSIFSQVTCRHVLHS